MSRGFDLNMGEWMMSYLFVGKDDDDGKETYIDPLKSHPVER